MRDCGILFPIFSLPSKFEVGSFSKEAYEFIDFLTEASVGYWQILPIGPTGFGDSPYQAVSAFAGNPYFVSPEELINEGLLTWDEAYSFDFGNDEQVVDYGALYNNRYALLEIAYHRFIEQGLNNSKEYKAFLKEHAYWLDDYTLFMVIKKSVNGKSWLEWDTPLKNHDEKALEKFKKENAEMIDFYSFIQYKFNEQYVKLRTYANNKGVKIIGDIPFYTALDSVDVWAHKEVFLMNKNGTPKVVAGCAPDDFSPTGQLWGNPIYDWKALKENDYDWWMKRLERSFEVYDTLRIDHFHGFNEYYAIPYGDTTAENGKAHKGPGADFFKAYEKKFGKIDPSKSMNIIAEDLGTITKENVKLLTDFNIPGMKILEYAFTSWQSIYLPYFHTNNAVVYPGTHDNAPLRAWLEEISDTERKFVKDYINSGNEDYGAITWDLIRECYKSVCNLCIVPLYDYLCKGNEARINRPGTATDNWKWRLQPNFLSHELAYSMAHLASTYGRVPEYKKEIK